MNSLECAAREYFRGRAGAVVSTSLSVDATVTSLLGPLVTGTCVKLLPDGEHMLAALRAAHVKVVEMEVMQPDLEEVFVQIMQHA